jgi:hypothetical protein
MRHLEQICAKIAGELTHEACFSQHLHIASEQSAPHAKPNLNHKRVVVQAEWRCLLIQIANDEWLHDRTAEGSHVIRGVSRTQLSWPAYHAPACPNGCDQLRVLRSARDAALCMPEFLDGQRLCYGHEAEQVVGVRMAQDHQIHCLPPACP